MRRETKLKHPPHTAIVVITVLITFGLVAAGYDNLFFNFYTQEIKAKQRISQRLPPAVDFDPIIRKVLSIDREKVDFFRIYSLSDGVVVSVDRYIDPVVERLNSMRFWMWTPAPSQGHRIIPIWLDVYMNGYTTAPLLSLGLYKDHVTILTVNFYCGSELYDMAYTLWEEFGGNL